jgi:hypothetical protein
MNQLNIVIVTLHNQTLLKQFNYAAVSSGEIMNQKGKQISLIRAKCEQENPQQTHYMQSERNSLVLPIDGINIPLRIHAALYFLAADHWFSTSHAGRGGGVRGKFDCIGGKTRNASSTVGMDTP